MTPIKHIVTTICVAAAVVAAIPAVAQAKPAGGFKQATFKATLSGSQVTIWEYHKPDDPNNRCDAGSDGYGDQTIKFDAKRTFKVNFTTPPKGQPNLFGTRGRPSVFTTPLFLPVDATAERNGDYKVHYGQIAKDCPGESGGNGDYIPTPHDCGVRKGGFQARLFFHDPSPDAGLIPVQRHLPEKNTLRLEANVYEWFKADGSNSAVQLDDSYQNCPLLLESSYVERAGNIWTSGAHVSESALFNKKRKKIVVSGHTIQKFGNGGESTGKTILAWNLRLTRVK